MKANTPIKIGIRCDAGKTIGMGHLIRSLALARELRQRGALCWFNSNAFACRLAVREGFTVVDSANGLPEMRADAWIVDLKRGCPPHLAQHLRPLCDTFVILNGVGWDTEDPARFLADLIFYQGCSERPRQLDWGVWGGAWFEGPEWVILRPEFARLRRHRQEPHDPPRILVSGGGADNGGTNAAITGLLVGEGYDIRVIVGPAADADDTRPLDVEVFRNPAHVEQVMAWADLAVVSYGMTAFECLALGLPTVAVCQVEEQRAGATIATALSGEALTPLNSVEWVREIVKSKLRMLEIDSRHALDFVDGLGAGRVADKIMERVAR